MERDSLVSVVAANIRQHRLDAGLSQDQLANRLRIFGQDWNRNSVAALENGFRNIGIEEFYALAAAFRLSPDALLQTSVREVQVGALRVPGHELVDMHSDPAPVFDHGRRVEQLANDLRDVIRTALVQAGSKATNRKVNAVTEAMHRQTEREAAQRLGIAPAVAAAIAVALWGRSLTDERDRLARPEAAGMELSWVTRRLLAELEERGRATGLITEEP